MMQARDPVVFNRVTTVAGTQKGEGFLGSCRLKLF